MPDTSTKKQEDQPQIEISKFMKFSKVVTWFLYFWVMIGVISLVLRVFLLAFSASATSNFVDFVYRVSDDYLEPFRGMFPPGDVGETGYLDISAIFAIFVYLFIAWGVNMLITYVQNKIDISVAEQEAAIAKAEREAQLEKVIEAKKEIARQQTKTRSAKRTKKTT